MTASWSGHIKKALQARETAILIAFLIIAALATMTNSKFLFSTDGWKDLWLAPSILLLLAVGETFVILTKHVDLSVGSVVGLTAFSVGMINVAWPGLPPLFAFMIGIAIGAGLGFINGALVGVAKVPGMVITLGTMYAFRGVTIVWAGSRRINASELNPGLTDLGVAAIPGIKVPILTVIALVVVAAAAIYLRNTSSGRQFYAVGSAPEAAVLYGLPTAKRMLTAFMISGACAGMAGVMFAARYGTIASTAGDGLEMQAIGAAVIGGVAIVGGSGTALGAAIGAFLLATINRALPIWGIQDFWQKAVLGTLILGAIILDRVLANRTSRRLVAERLTS